MALIEAHEGNKNKIYKMIEKYNIEDPKAIEQLLKLNSILRDADALDRVRLDVKFPKYRVNLKPKYLDNKTSKQLLNASYQLEFLTEQIKDIRTILESFALVEISLFLIFKSFTESILTTLFALISPFLIEL